MNSISTDAHIIQFIVTNKSLGETKQWKIRTRHKMNEYENIDVDILSSDVKSEYHTIDKFIWSPTTAVGNPKEVIKKLAEKFERLGGTFKFNSKVNLKNKNNEVLIEAQNITYTSKRIINSAGAYASDLAKQVQVGKQYVCLPFLGAYKKSLANVSNPKRLIYPVPNPINPFLGVHTTNTLNNEIKIGPTAFPVIGKEQYRIHNGFKMNEFIDFYKASKSLMKSKEVDFKGLAKEEFIKLFTGPLLKKTRKLSDSLGSNMKWSRYPAGIRAQIINTQTNSIEMDYIVENDKNVVHILNAVSPGWTSAIPFARWVVENQPLLR